MTPLHHLLIAVDLTPAELATRILDVGAAFGATRSAVSGSRIREWHDGSKPMPGWAHTATLLLASRANWRAESAEELDIACTSYRRQWPDHSMSTMIKILGGAVVASEQLTTAWDKVSRKSGARLDRAS